MDRYIIALGGGEIKDKTTLKMDEYIANLAKKHAGEKRARGLFIGTASHDSMPYFNSFRKTYTSVFDIKADCVLCVYGEMNAEKIAEKFTLCDFIYVGGGDTVYMLEKWKEAGIDKLVKEAYERGVIIAGLSAGAICWFEDMYTDSPSVTGEESYALFPGADYLDGVCCPHFELREKDYIEALKKSPKKYQPIYGIEGDAGLVFKNEKLSGGISSGGKAYTLRINGEVEEKFEITPINDK